LLALRPELLAAVGEFAPLLEAQRAVLGESLLTAPDVERLAPELAKRLSGDELIVLKGSRGVALERLLPDLAARPSPTT
jgi:UDP-N-acetylmuramoyl-tripeptide--D-alanyl-D-alanine ligase